MCNIYKASSITGKIYLESESKCVCSVTLEELCRLPLYIRQFVDKCAFGCYICLQCSFSRHFVEMTRIEGMLKEAHNVNVVHRA